MGHHNKYKRMKKFELLQNHQNMTQGHKVSKYYWKNSTDRLVQHKLATSLQFVKSSVSAKQSKAQFNETRYAHIYLFFK